MAELRSRLTYANVVATLALFLALGGTSYAALRVGSREIRNNSVRSVDMRNNDIRSTDIRNNDVTGADIRKDTVTGGDIKDRSIGGRDLAPETLDGLNVKNLTSGDFAPGQLPDPLPATLPRGKTLTGVYAAAVTGDAGSSGVGRGPISFSTPLATQPTGAAYIAGGTAPTAACPGSVDNPQAAGGILCVYEAAKTGTVSLAGFFDPVSGKNFESSRFGAVAFVNGDAGAAIRGTWALTAP